MVIRNVEIISASTMEIERCEIKIERGDFASISIHNARFGVLQYSDNNLFAAINQFRLYLEQNGYVLLCNAARCDAYPSNMALGAGGWRLYRLKFGMQAKMEDLIDIFDPAPPGLVCTVAKQRANYEKWLNSL